jgi:hypothetical protein
LADVQLALFILISLVIGIRATVQNIVLISPSPVGLLYTFDVRGLSYLSEKWILSWLHVRWVPAGFCILFHHLLPNVLNPVIVLAS